MGENRKKIKNKFKAFSNKKSGAHPVQLRKLFNALVLSKIVYGTLTIPITTKQAHYLQVIQKMGTRMAWV